MAKGKRTKLGQTMVYKTLHRNVIGFGMKCP
jgi:hypothetical protein